MRSGPDTHVEALHGRVALRKIATSPLPFTLRVGPRRFIEGPLRREGSLAPALRRHSHGAFTRETRAGAMAPPRRASGFGKWENETGAAPHHRICGGGITGSPNLVPSAASPQCRSSPIAVGGLRFLASGPALVAWMGRFATRHSPAAAKKDIPATAKLSLGSNTQESIHKKGMPFSADARDRFLDPALARQTTWQVAY